ncbi:hypothetical protein ACFX11_035364 [Malus domestica]
MRKTNFKPGLPIPEQEEHGGGEASGAIDGGEVGGSNQSGVTLELHQLPRANENQPEFQDGKALFGSGWHHRLQVEEGYTDLLQLEYNDLYNQQAEEEKEE